MIESSVNQVALQQKQANISDMVVAQHAEQAKVEERKVEESSTNPTTQIGVANSDVQAAPVSSQPTDVVTKLGEAQESPNLYQPTHQSTGKIIRPEITTQSEVQAQSQTAAEQQSEQVQTQEAKNSEAPQATPTNPKSWATDTNQLLGN